jgi:hypothetical protein
VLERLGIDDVESVSLRAGFVAAALNIVVLVYGIEDRAVHARGKFDGAEDLIVLSAHQFDHAEIIAVRHDQLVDIRQKERGMRLTKSSDAVKVLAVEVENLNALLIFGGEKQALALEIQRKVVKIARETRQGSGGQQLQRQLVLCCSHGGKCKNQR